MNKGNNLTKLVYSVTQHNESKVSKYGEVFTPEHLILRMLNQIPEHYLYSTEYKWYDPTAGYGQFPSVIVKVLMETLKDKIPDENERFKHIVEKQIYMSEYQPTSANLIRECFTSIDPNIKLNLYVGSSLDLDIKEQWGINKVDITFFNPPYNDEKGANKKKVTGNMGTSFYKLFTEKAIKETDKLIGAILPSTGYKSMEHKDWKLIRYINNRNDDWLAKKIHTRSFILEKNSEEEFNFYPPLFSKILNKDKLYLTYKDTPVETPLEVKTLSKRDSVSLKQMLSKNNKNSFTMKVSLTSTPLNAYNLNYLLSFLLNLYSEYVARVNSFIGLLDIEWLEGIDREITDQDIINYYKLTPEEVQVIKNCSTKDTLLKDFR